MKLLKELPELEEDDLASVVYSADSKVSSRRLGGQISSANLKPLINEASRIIVIPETFKEPDNYLGIYVLKAAMKLKYTVKVIPYHGARQEIPKTSEQRLLGIYMSLDDSEAMFRFTKKEDNYEIGRAYARSQAIIGALQHRGMDASVLKENQVYFGNYRPPTGTQKGTKPLDQYWIHQLPAMVMERDWANECSKIAISLLRKAWILIDPGILWDNMVSQHITYSNVVSEYCSKDVVIEPSRGKKKAVVAKKVPQKVRSNSLLLKSELEIINRLADSIFSRTPWEQLSQEEWVMQLWTEGLDKIRSALSANYACRAQFLSKLAALTTKRLRLIRETGEKKHIRKADVQASDLSSLLLSKGNPVQAFVQEILNLDPTGELFLKEWFVGVYADWSKVGSGTSFQTHLKRKVANEVYESNPYDELLKDRDDLRQEILSIATQMEQHRQEEETFLAEVESKIGSATMAKWKTNLRKFSLEEQSNAALSERGLRRPPSKRLFNVTEVPHEPKPRASKKKPKVQKLNPHLVQTAAEQGVTFRNKVTVLHDQAVTIFVKSQETDRPIDRLVQAYLYVIHQLREQHTPLPDEFNTLLKIQLDAEDYPELQLQELDVFFKNVQSFDIHE
jgi:hypothetical protein